MHSTYWRKNSCIPVVGLLHVQCSFSSYIISLATCFSRLRYGPPFYLCVRYMYIQSKNIRWLQAVVAKRKRKILFTLKMSICMKWKSCTKSNIQTSSEVKIVAPVKSTILNKHREVEGMLFPVIQKDLKVYIESS